MMKDEGLRATSCELRATGYEQSTSNPRWPVRGYERAEALVVRSQLVAAVRQFPIPCPRTPRALPFPG
jgi:hypothetical protein